MNWMVLNLNKLESPPAKDALSQTRLQLPPWFWRRRFLNFVDAFSLSHWKRTVFFIWTNLKPLHPKIPPSKFSWNWHLCSGNEDFEIVSMYFRLFVITSPWKRAGSFICSNFNPLHPRMLYAKFGWNGFSGSREVDENVKNYDNDNALDDRERTTDKYWSEKFIWDFGSGELKSDEPLYRSEPSLYITYYCSIC